MQSGIVDLPFASVAVVCASVVCIIASVVSRSVVKMCFDKTIQTCKATF